MPPSWSKKYRIGDRQLPVTLPASPWQSAGRAGQFISKIARSIATIMPEIRRRCNLQSALPLNSLSAMQTWGFTLSQQTCQLSVANVSLMLNPVDLYQVPTAVWRNRPDLCRMPLNGNWSFDLIKALLTNPFSQFRHHECTGCQAAYGSVCVHRGEAVDRQTILDWVGCVHHLVNCRRGHSVSHFSLGFLAACKGMCMCQSCTGSLHGSPFY